MTIAKKLAAGLLAALMLVPVLHACSAEDDLRPEPEFDNEPLPAYYNLFDEGRMTPAKSQGGTGLCWAFGTLSTVESAILTAGLAGADGGEQSGCAPVGSTHFPDFEIPPSLKNTAEFRIAVHPGESFAMRGGKWHDLADGATAELFGKDHPIGNIGIKALLAN